MANQDWMNQNNYQKSQLDWLSQILRGLPAQQSTYTTNTQTPTLANQMSPLAAATQGFVGAKTLATPAQYTYGKQTTGA